MSLTGDTEKSDGQIRNFYAGKHVFLTGCTGFYGSLILEKLLRTCTEIGKIYVMVRDKKGFSIQDRMERFFKKDVFDRLRKENPNFMNKVILVYGDLYQPDLGLSAEDRQRLINNVNIIIHNASVVYFEAKVSFLFRTNVIGTQKMLELAAECPSLNVFIYVSTAYSHHYMNPIEEKFYPPPCGLDMVEDIIRADEENAAGLSKEALNDIVGKWLNQYAFSKAVAEGVVENFARRRSLPCMIYRPSIIMHALREPHPGWLNTKNGVVPLLTMTTLGLLHTLYVRPDVMLDIVPVDMTTTGLLTAIWDYVVNRETNEPQVYNYASSDWNPISLFAMKPDYMRTVEESPSTKMIWYPFVIFTQNFYLFLMLHVLFHMFPATIADAVLMIQGKKPKVLKMIYKVTKQFQLLNYFISTSWVIRTDKLKSIMNSSMNSTDLEEFSFDMTLIDWHGVTERAAINIRTTLNDPIETVPHARKKLRKLKMLHYTTLTLFFILAFFFLYTILCIVICSVIDNHTQ